MIERKELVTIYCKVFSDSFSSEMISRKRSGLEIYDFLMKDAGLSVDDEGTTLPGDLNLWYLGSNAKFGLMRYKDKVFAWDFGESSFDLVQSFISAIYRDGLFSKDQYIALLEKVEEGRLIDNFLDIPKYLMAKKRGISWVKTDRAKHFRTDMRCFVGRVQGHTSDDNVMFVYRD